MRTSLKITISLLLLSAAAWAQGAFFGTSGVVCRAPNYCSYTGVNIVQPLIAPYLGALTKNGAVAYDASYPSGSINTISRCTDAGTLPNHLNFSFAAGLGGSGAASQLWNADDTMLHIENSAGGFLTLFNPHTMACGDPVTGRAITADKNLTNPGSSGTAYNFGAGSFDWRNPSIWYSFDFTNDDSSNEQVVSYTFNTANGQFTVGPLIADFAFALPTNANAPAWQASHAYATGQYVSYTLSSVEAPDWASGRAYVLGDLIKPLTGNSAGCAFKVTVAGTSASAQPSWGSVCGLATLTDGGGVSFRGIDAPPSFVFQLTSAGGTSGSSTPAFVPTSTHHPDLATTVSDNGLTWTNVGPNLVTPAGKTQWNSFAGVSRDGARFCSATSTNSYGYNGSYTQYNADQGTGIFEVCYSSSLNKYFLLNTATGVVSSTSCIGGSGYNCSGGTLAMAPVGTSTVISGSCRFFIHNSKGSTGQDYLVIQIQTALSGSSCNTASVWDPFAAFSSANSVQLMPVGLNHWAPGFTSLVNIGQNGSILGGFTGGAYSQIFDMTNLANTAFTSWQASPCDLSWAPNHANPPCQFSLAYDQHMSWAYNPFDLDNTPVCGTVYNLATNSPIPVAVWQGEEMCFSTFQKWNNLSLPGAQVQWRHAHTFNTGTNLAFSDQFTVSEMDQVGRFLAWGSDWMCGLGTTAGGTSPLCGPQWVASTAYVVGTMLNPFSGNAGSGTNYGVYQVATGGTSAASAPVWFVCNSGMAGSTVTDANGLVYACLGTSNARADVFVVNTDSSSNFVPSYVLFSWGASATAGVTYNVYRGTSPGVCPGTPYQAGLSGLSYLDMNTTLGQTYYYNVSAVSGGGETCSATESSITIP